jgi:hypothetical protein
MDILGGRVSSSAWNSGRSTRPRRRDHGGRREHHDRSLMIFGQGAIRCHPWVMQEMKAAQLGDPVERIDRFDGALFGHIGFAISNAVRSWWYGLTSSKIGAAPGDDDTRRYFRKLNRYSAPGGDGRHPC